MKVLTPYWDVAGLKELKKTEQIFLEFEKILLNMFVKEASKPVFGDAGFIGGSFQSDIYRDIYNMGLIDTAAGFLGISEFLRANFER